VKGWGESVSELMIVKKNNYNKLYTVLSYLGVFTFCTCCIVICLVCIVASFSCLVCNCSWLAVCIVAVCVYCCSYLVCIVVI